MICLWSTKSRTNREHWASFPPLFEILGCGIIWRALGVEESLDNSIVNVAPLFVTHRVGVVAHPILVFVEYSPVGIIPTTWACWDYCFSSAQWVESVLGGCTTQVDYDAGVVQHDSWGSLLGRSVGNRMGWAIAPLYHLLLDMGS